MVIASGNGGAYETASAPGTANGLRTSLPHIRIGLLVGVEAGVPGEGIGPAGNTTIKRDVFLGGVVISNPDSSGMVQHDLLKAEFKNGETITEIKGFLNAPPRVICSALSAIQADHKRGDARMSESPAVFQNNEVSGKSYRYPGSSFYRVRCAVNQSREQRKIHYGTIASVNTLLGNGPERDALLNWFLKQNIDPICFKMAAAGLIDSFPSLVIRGIHDYADEHRNFEWQRYAAAAAAAFAKELLGYLDAEELCKTPVLGDTFKAVLLVNTRTGDSH